MPHHLAYAIQVFQFHIVRLKGLVHWKAPRIAGRFQFHIVRLKASVCRSAGLNARSLFQFHIVRLKENIVKHFFG